MSKSAKSASKPSAGLKKKQIGGPERRQPGLQRWKQSGELGKKPQSKLRMRLRGRPRPRLLPNLKLSLLSKRQMRKPKPKPNRKQSRR